MLTDTMADLPTVNARVADHGWAKMQAATKAAKAGRRRHKPGIGNLLAGLRGADARRGNSRLVAADPGVHCGVARRRRAGRSDGNRHRRTRRGLGQRSHPRTARAA